MLTKYDGFIPVTSSVKCTVALRNSVKTSKDFKLQCSNYRPSDIEHNYVMSRTVRKKHSEYYLQQVLS
uniref:Uncharacterized protein n=1 Tax=Anopheles minimus TaxID=112268 RepID=A0A182WQE5_9DIPT